MKFSKEHYERLDSIKARAQYLLSFPIEAKICIENLNLVLRAVVCDVVLPVTGETEQETIEKARQWLQDKVGPEAFEEARQEAKPLLAEGGYSNES